MSFFGNLLKWGVPRFATDPTTGAVTAIADPTGVNPYGFAALPLDANGNAIANVNHRTGTLTSLLTLSGGGGEISVATDYDAIVRHNGTAGQAKAFYANPEFLALVAERTSALSVGNAADTVVPSFTTEYVDPLGMMNLTTGEITIPSGYSGMSLIASLGWGDAAVASSNLRKVWMQAEAAPTFWFDFGIALIMNSVANNSTYMGYFVADFGNNVASNAGKKLRLVARQESGGAINLNSISLAIRLRK